jgi:hypothetical protein
LLRWVDLLRVVRGSYERLAAIATPTFLLQMYHFTDSLG